VSAELRRRREELNRQRTLLSRADGGPVRISSSDNACFTIFFNRHLSQLWVSPIGNWFGSVRLARPWVSDRRMFIQNRIIPVACIVICLTDHSLIHFLNAHFIYADGLYGGAED
jgi:hypothetical protein